MACRIDTIIRLISLISTADCCGSGAGRLLRTLIKGRVARCDLLGASFIEMGYAVGQAGIINEGKPDGDYAIWLEEPLQRQVIIGPAKGLTDASHLNEPSGSRLPSSAW